MVRLKAYGGEIIERVLVQQDAGHVYVCTLNEYEDSRRTGREPTCAGFAIEFLVNEEAE